MKKYLKRKTFKLKKEVEVSNKFNKAIEKSSPFEEMVKNNEEYKILLERKKLGESVEDLIRQNRINAKIQLRNITNKFGKNVEEFMKNEMEYDNLMKRKKEGEPVWELIKKNRIYAEELRIDYMKARGEANEWLRMNPDIFQNPVEKSMFLRTFRLWPIMNKDQKCPDCRVLMNYLEYLDAYQCLRCKNKYYLWEKKLRILGQIYSTILDEDRAIMESQREDILSKTELREKRYLTTKFRDKMDKRAKILKEIMKCNDEYKILLEQKNAGEPVEDLIKQNRKYRKILAKEEREKIEEFNDWKKSEEGRKLSAMFEETRRLNPDLTRDVDIRLERGFKISKEFTKNEEEYEKLLERKNKGEYIDDLIKQNRYKAKVLDEQKFEVKAIPKKLITQKQKHLENIEEEIEQYKKFQQELKTRLAQLIIEINRTVLGIRKERLNEAKNVLTGEIKMVGLIIDNYEIRSKVKKLDIEHKKLVAKNLKGEFVDDLLKSNRFEVELLNKQDKEYSDIIKELIMKQGEKKREYRRQFEMFDEDILSKIEGEKTALREKRQLATKFGDKMDKGIKLLEEIKKIDEEYKVLLARKETGESVENLIKKNRKYAKILTKKDREWSKVSKKWRKSEEGRKTFELFEETLRLNPDLTRDDDIRYIKGLKIVNKIKKNEKEYEKLLERKNKGEFVDDLIKQNRYTAKALVEQNKKVWD